MRYLVITDTYPPLRSSGAIQLRDLSIEFVKQGHRVSVLVASPDLDRSCFVDKLNGVEVIRIKTPQTKDVGYVRRTIAEILMPFCMLYKIQKIPGLKLRWDGIIWYSPTIFLGPVVKALKLKNKCKAYLIVRDIFPDWAVDMGLMRKNGLPYCFFSAVAKFQYSLADTIGIQTKGNEKYFTEWLSRSDGRLEILQNWSTVASKKVCSLSLKNTPLAEQRVFVYAGNMGIAQGMGVLMELAEKMIDRPDIGFLFVGRGSEVLKLKSYAKERELGNILFCDEIDPEEIPSLYDQCDIGLVALDPKHKSHNIPGKFISYMGSGLPVLATVNKGNDIVDIIDSYGVGRVHTADSTMSLCELAKSLLADLDEGSQYHVRCKKLFNDHFSTEIAVKNIVNALC
jgi:glycosyltransferase involved in cell wall biosynthesis